MPKEIADSVSDTEKKRQEAINEAIYTERDFVRDMEYLRDVSNLDPVHSLRLTLAHRFGLLLSKNQKSFQRIVA